MFPITQIRLARPTHQLKQVLRFYETGMQLKRIGEFQDHEGYSGVMLGMPDNHIHLEFTEHREAVPMPPPSPEHLLVFYFASTAERDAYVQRLFGLGFIAVPPENPYWRNNGVTIEDPNGWRVVLMNITSFTIGTAEHDH